MNSTTTSSRPFYFAVALLCSALLGFGYYLQFAKDLEPCPLCIFQRLAYIAVAVVAVAGLVQGPRGFGRRIYGALLAAAAVVGAVVAGRQVWLQHLPPDQVPSCGPGLDYMLEVFPLADAVKMAFTGSGECAEVDWTFLSLSIAEWSLIFFACLTVAAVVHASGKGFRAT